MSVFDRPEPPCDVYPVQLKAGDVIDVPGRGEITLADDGNVRSSKPTHTWFKVFDGEPFEIDAFHGGTVRLVRRVDPATLKKPAAPAKRKVPEPPRKPPAGGREVPLAEVGWGTYGWIKAMGPDGSATIETGYITTVPRVYTGGLMSRPKLTDPILHFNMVDPGRTHVGMNALLDTTFVVLDPPKDRPLNQKPSDSRRMPVRDTRAGDLVEVTFPDEDPNGRLGRHGPEVELTEDPKDVGDGYVELTGSVAGGPVETFMMRGKEWVNVEGPAVRHLVDQDPTARMTTDTAGGRELPAPGETKPDARWLLLGQVSPGYPGPADAQLRRARMYAAMRRVYQLPIDAPIGEILAARDDVDCRWSVKCDAYWRAYAALMHEEGVARTAAAEPFPAGEPTVDGDLPAPRDLIPAERWWMLVVVSAIYGTAAAAARRARVLAAMRRVHNLPADATMQQIEAAQEADVRRHSMRCWAYWEAYAALLAEEGAARTIREEPLPKQAAKRTAAPARAARKQKPATQQIPLTEVTWGAYGEVKGFFADASPYTGKGYVTLLPRIYTGGIGVNSKFKGKELLSFVLYEPYGGNRGGITTHMTAKPESMFTPLDPPADRPLDEEPTDSRRMPVFDLRADDIIPPQYHGDKQPEMLLLEDPKPLGPGRVELTVKVNGVVEKKRYNGDTWVTVEGPALRRAQAAADTAPAADEQPSEEAAVPAGATIHCPACGRNAKVTPTLKIRAHGQDCEMRGKPVPAGVVVVSLPAAEPEPLFDMDAMTAFFGGIGEQMAAETPPAPAEGTPAHTHISGTVKLPYDTQGGGKEGDVVPAHVCCACGGVELSEFALGNNHGCCRDGQRSDRPICSIITSSKHLNQHWTPPAPPNAGPVLDELRALAGNPLYGRCGRKNAAEHAERYAAGLPLVRFNRIIAYQWTWNCPVPTCLIIRDGHDTIREARASWFAHAVEHEGFTPSWPDDLLPEEPEQEVAQVKRLRKAKTKRRGPLPAIIEVIEPVDNEWWDDSALAWEQCGLLRREKLRTADGVKTLASLLISQGTAKAVEFEELLATVGGIDPATMTVHTLSSEEERAEWDRNRAEHDALWRARQGGRAGEVDATLAQQAVQHPLRKLRREADQVVTDFEPDGDRDRLVWALAVTYAGGPSAVKRYLDADRKPEAFFGGLHGLGNIGKHGRGHDAEPHKVEVYQMDYSAFPHKREVLAMVTWGEIADLVETALGKNPRLAKQLVAAADNLASSDYADRLAAKLWRSVRPTEPAAAVKEPAAPEVEPLTLFDLDVEGISAAVQAALAGV